MPHKPETDIVPSSRRNPRNSYLVVDEGAQARIVRLDSFGHWTIGTAEGADIRLQGNDIAPEHARLELQGDEAYLVPTAREHVVRINDQPAGQRHPLHAGDVITVGDASLEFHGAQARPSQQPSTIDFERFVHRLDEELERSLRYGHPFVLLALKFEGTPAPRTVDRIAQLVRTLVRTVDIISSGRPNELLVLFPETTLEQAEIPTGRILGAIARDEEVSGGLSACPADGVDGEALLSGARLAAAEASAGTYLVLADAVSRWTVGEIEVLALDPLSKKIFDLVRRIAASDIPVLIVGETGTGKEVVAQAIHAWSKRASKKMFSINCASVPETLIESELFGHERGAFSGAIATKKGLFEQADGSTIFLDEIGELSPKSQAEFLRVLETKRFTRVGSLRERTTDVRIIAATNRPLEQEIAEGRFRQDLYFRLNTANIPLPPLRDHPLDIPVLARHFLAKACEREGRTPIRLADDAVRRLALHGWPGNVRELRNLMDYVAATCPRNVAHADDFPQRIAESVAPWFRPPAESSPPPPNGLRPAPVPQALPEPTPDNFPNIYEEIEQLERTRIRQALEAAEGVRVRAAELIGMPLRTFVSKMKRYGLDEIRSTRKRRRRSS